MENEGQTYNIYSAEQKIISDYTGLNFVEISDLCFDEYKILFRDAYIYKLQQTEQGREYLEKCYMLENTNTKPDRKKLREKFNK